MTSNLRQQLHDAYYGICQLCKHDEEARNEVALTGRLCSRCLYDVTAPPKGVAQRHICEVPDFETLLKKV